jgi:hypothetical protein
MRSALIPNNRFDVPGDCSVELSALGNQFFTDIFEAYDQVSPAAGALSGSLLFQSILPLVLSLLPRRAILAA